MNRAILPLCVAALIVPTIVAAKGGGGRSPASAVTNNSAEFETAAQCAGVYRFLATMIPPSAPQRAIIDQRQAAWLTHASRFSSGGAATAGAAAAREADVLAARLKALNGDQQKFGATMAPLNAQCENLPSAAAPPASLAKRAGHPSASSIRASEGKIKCAGLHVYFEREGGAKTVFVGDSKLFVDAIVKDRPDLTRAQIDAKIAAEEAKWAAAYARSTDDYVAALERGEVIAPKPPEGLIKTSEECDGAASFLRQAKG